VILGGGPRRPPSRASSCWRRRGPWLLLERRDELPPAARRWGRRLVQVSGYYFSKVLDLEEYLLREHYLKYNLRFYWPSPERTG
jgi:hypothetical protein